MRWTRDVSKRGVISAINQATFESGDTFMQVEALLQTTQQILEHSQNARIDPALIKRALLTLTSDGIVIADGQNLYIKALFEAEREIAQRMVRLSKTKNSEYKRADVVNNWLKSRKKIRFIWWCAARCDDCCFDE